MKKKNNKNKIVFFDTTLRDGEQAPGASLNIDQKLQIARQLARLKVDVIEAGFPIASAGDFEAVLKVSKEVKGPIICGLSRCRVKDIEVASEALKKAKRSRIHVFLATSKIHREHKLRKPKEEIVKIAVSSVKLARKFCNDIEFSPEDAARTERDFLLKVVESVIKAGATTVNIPDTVGYSYPDEFADIIELIMNKVPNINKAVISVHCHNDLGLAVANSLAAIRSGARQIECTINGVGERAGNASLEEIVMTIKTRPDLFPGIFSNIDTRQIYLSSQMVSKLTGFVVPPNKAIVGANAFRHESGIHQDGVLKERTTYEIISPEDVGYSGSFLVLGKHSGRHAFRKRLEELGYSLTEKELEQAFMRFKDIADKKKEIYNEDLVALVEETFEKIPLIWGLEIFQVSSGNNMIPTATLRLRFKDKIFEDSASGDGPVDACFKAIEKIVKVKAKLKDYNISAITGGKDALGEVRISVLVNKELLIGRAASTDIIEASVKAYLNAINKAFLKKKSKSKLKSSVEL